MKEKILEIFEEYLADSEFDYNAIANEILELGWYPKEFVEWIGENEFYRNKGEYGKWIFQGEPYIIWKTTEEIYQYWNKYIFPVLSNDTDIDEKSYRMGFNDGWECGRTHAPRRKDLSEI